MFNLFVYNKPLDKAESLSEKCGGSIDDDVKSSFFDDSIKLEQETKDFKEQSLYVLKSDETLDKTSLHIRKLNDSNYIVLVLNSVSELIDAVSPSVRPSGLLLADDSDEHISRVMNEIYTDYSRNIKTAAETYYCFRANYIDYKVNFDEVIMIEVQRKKITLHTNSQSYGFYDSLEAVISSAPDYFLRIHRSYVINRNYIKNVNYKEKSIELTDGSVVFFSRNYAPDIKALIAGKF